MKQIFFSSLLAHQFSTDVCVQGRKDLDRIAAQIRQNSTMETMELEQ